MLNQNKFTLSAMLCAFAPSRDITHHAEGLFYGAQMTDIQWLEFITRNESEDQQGKTVYLLHPENVIEFLKKNKPLDK